MEKYCRIKVYIKCNFLFLLNSKTKYTSQTLTINHILYKTHKSTTFDLNIRIVIVAVVTQYKMQAPAFLIVVNSYGLWLDKTIMLKLGVVERLKVNEIILGLLYLRWDGMKDYKSSCTRACLGLGSMHVWGLPLA